MTNHEIVITDPYDTVTVVGPHDESMPYGPDYYVYEDGIGGATWYDGNARLHFGSRTVSDDIQYSEVMENGPNGKQYKLTVDVSDVEIYDCVSGQTVTLSDHPEWLYSVGYSWGSMGGYDQIFEDLTLPRSHTYTKPEEWESGIYEVSIWFDITVNNTNTNVTRRYTVDLSDPDLWV